MSSDSSNSSKGGGNNILPPKDVVKQISPAKRWCFTFNNYTEDDISSIVPVFRDTCVKYIFGKEVGESGTPHLQGYCEFKTKKRPMSVFGDYKIHWSKCKGNAKSNYDYCSKESDVIVCEGFPKPPTTIKRSDFYDWQEKMACILEKPCEWNDRTIYWRAGDVNIGKTQFAKWLCVHLGAVVIGGTGKHILAQVQNSPAPIYIVLLSYGDEMVSYRALEQVKDGLFSSAFGCDNNKMEIRDAPHILIIGNELPDVNNRHFHPTKYDVSSI